MGVVGTISCAVGGCTRWGVVGTVSYAVGGSLRWGVLHRTFNMPL